MEKPLRLNQVSPALQKIFCDALYQTYNNVGYDAWGAEHIPTVQEYTDVVLDHVEIQGGLTAPERVIWRRLSYTGKKTLARKVGP